MEFFLTVHSIKITQYAILTDFPYAKKEKKNSNSNFAV